ARADQPHRLEAVRRRRATLGRHPRRRKHRQRTTPRPAHLLGRTQPGPVHLLGLHRRTRRRTTTPIPPLGYSLRTSCHRRGLGHYHHPRKPRQLTPEAPGSERLQTGLTSVSRAFWYGWTSLEIPARSEQLPLADGNDHRGCRRGRHLDIVAAVVRRCLDLALERQSHLDGRDTGCGRRLDGHLDLPWRGARGDRV